MEASMAYDNIYLWNWVTNKWDKIYSNHSNEPLDTYSFNINTTYFNQTGGIEVLFESAIAMISGTASAEIDLYDTYIHPTATFSAINTTEGATPFYITYPTPAENPLSCGEMGINETCRLNWTVNATGNINSAWKIDVNFVSSLSLWSDTDDAVVKITEVDIPPLIWNLVIRNTTDNPINETRPAREVRITVNVSDENLDYVEANFTWPNGTTFYENLTSITGKPYTHNWTYWLPPTMPNGTAKINVTAYDIYGLTNSTNTTLEILEYYEFDLYNTPVNFSKVYPGELVSAIEGEGWPLLATIQGNVPINLTQYAEPYLTGLEDPTENVTIRNITWNTSEFGLVFSQLSDIETVVNESVQSGSWQQAIYYKFSVPTVRPQRYGGIVYIKTKKLEESP